MSRESQHTHFEDKILITFAGEDKPQVVFDSNLLAQVPAAEPDTDAGAASPVRYAKF